MGAGGLILVEVFDAVGLIEDVPRIEVFENFVSVDLEVIGILIEEAFGVSWAGEARVVILFE